MGDGSAYGRWRAGVAASAIRRRWRIVVGTALIVAGLVALLIGAQPHSYSASVAVFIRPLEGNAFTPETLSNSQVTTVALNTEAGLVTSTGVADRVKARLGTPIAAAAIRVNASVPADTQLVVIAAHGDSAARVKRYAAAYANAFLDFRAALARKDQRAALARLAAERATAQTRLADASRAANVAHPPAGAASELQLATAQLASIETAIGQVSSMDTDPGSVVRPAHLASGGLFDNVAVVLLLSLAAGAVVGVLTAIWRELRDDRLHASDEATVEDVPVLAFVRSDRAETAVRDLRTGVIAAARDGAVLAITPCGASEAEAAASLAVELAHSLVAAGYRVVLADAALVTARVGALAGGDAPGLSDVLVEGGTATPTAAVGGMRVLPAGSHVEQARERYGGQAMTRVFAGLRADADYVLVVTPPADAGDGAAVLQTVERVLLVGTDAVTRRRHVRAAVQLADRLGGAVVGIAAVTPHSPPPQGPGILRSDVSWRGEEGVAGSSEQRRGERRGTLVSLFRGDGER